MEKMVDMKMSKGEGGPTTSMMGRPIEKEKDSGPKYPYGLQLRLETDELDKLDLEGCEVGDFYTVVAKCKVTSTNENESEDSESRCVTLQITKMIVKDLPSEDSEDEEVSKEDRHKKNLDQAEEIMKKGKRY